MPIVLLHRKLHTEGGEGDDGLKRHQLLDDDDRHQNANKHQGNPDLYLNLGFELFITDHGGKATMKAAEGKWYFFTKKNGRMLLKTVIGGR